MENDYTITTKKQFDEQIKNTFDTGKSISMACIPEDELQKASKDFSQGNANLENLLKTMWKSGIDTWGCSAEKDIEYVCFFVDNLSKSQICGLLDGFCARSENVNIVVTRRDNITDGKNKTRISVYNCGNCDEMFQNLADSVVDMAMLGQKDYFAKDEMVQKFSDDVCFLKNLEKN